MLLFRWDNILLDEKLWKTQENIFIYDISYKSFMGAKPLHIWLGDGIWYLVLFGPRYYDVIYNRIRYLISEKRDITGCINHNFARTRIDSYNSLPIEKAVTFHNVIILIKSVVNKNENSYFYNIFIEKGLYEDKPNTKYFLMNVCKL